MSLRLVLSIRYWRCSQHCFTPIRKSHLNIEKNAVVKLDENISCSNSKFADVVQENFVLHKNFISESEEDNLIKEIDPIFKRKRYQFDHWDGAIQGYKETEKLEWTGDNSDILKRLRAVAFPTEISLIPHVHVLDLSKTGHIKPHVDSVRFCGSTIAGISILSSSVMRLIYEEDKSVIVDVLLERRSLYIMRNIIRYQFTHEILGESSSYFKGKPIPRERRISIICRNEPDNKAKTQP